MCPIWLCCVISKYCRMTPEATIPHLRWSMPKPFRFFTSKCLSNFSVAVRSENTQSSSSNVKNFVPKQPSNCPRFPRSKSTSLGEKLPKSLSIYSVVPSAVRNSPVLMSKKATPTLFFPKCTAAKKLFSLLLNTLSFIATPGVTSSVMPRFTNVLVSFGSSNWSHIATRRPARINLGR